MILYFSAQLYSRNLLLNGGYVPCGGGHADPCTGWTTGTKGYVMPADGVLRHLHGQNIDAAGGGVGNVTVSIARLAVSNIGAINGKISEGYSGQMTWGGNPDGSSPPTVSALSATAAKVGQGILGNDVDSLTVKYGDRIFCHYDFGGQGLNSDWGRPIYCVELTL